MPNEMISKVAKAICAANNSGASEFDATGLSAGNEGYSPEWLYYVDDAKAAIQALMEPSESQINAGYDATRLSDGTPQFADAGFCLGHSRNIYQAMLRAALD